MKNNELIHYDKCHTCGDLFDMRNLDSVAYHCHEDLEINGTFIGKRGIKNAREVYPNCSSSFMCGVHLYLNGGGVPERPCEDEFMQGYLRAQIDLENNFFLIH